MRGSNISSSQKTAHVRRPSLLGSGSGISASGSDDNILDAISSAAPSRHKKLRALNWPVILLTPFVLFACWAVTLPLWHADKQTPVAPTTHANTRAHTPALATKNVVAQGNVPPHPLNKLDKQPSAIVIAAAPTHANNVAATTKKSPQKTVKTVKPVAASDTKAAKATQLTKPNKTKAVASDSRESKTKSTTAASNTKNTSRTSANADSDVALINALIVAMSTAPPAAGSSAQTIADLVATCKSKDAIDTLMCQRRICEGSWGKAQACPMKLAPKTIKN